MATSSEPKPVALSARIYQRLLALYPKEHQREYGPLMAQLFRDQCRDAWAEARERGLALLWLHIAIDLVKTSMLEHLQNLKHRTSMLPKALFAFRHNPGLRATFFAVFGPVFVLVLGSSILLAFLTTEQYQSIARIKMLPENTEHTPASYQGYVIGNYDPWFIQKQFELMQSEFFLGPVAKKLNLAEAWGKASAGGARLSEGETIRL